MFSLCSVSLSFSNHNLIAFIFPHLLDIGVHFGLVELFAAGFWSALRSQQISSASMPTVAPLSGTEHWGTGGGDQSESGSFSWKVSDVKSESDDACTPQSMNQ